MQIGTGTFKGMLIGVSIPVFAWSMTVLLGKKLRNNWWMAMGMLLATEPQCRVMNAHAAFKEIKIAPSGRILRLERQVTEPKPCRL